MIPVLFPSTLILVQRYVNVFYAYALNLNGANSQLPRSELMRSIRWRHVGVLDANDPDGRGFLVVFSPSSPFHSHSCLPTVVTVPASWETAKVISLSALNRECDFFVNCP